MTDAPANRRLAHDLKFPRSQVGSLDATTTADVLAASGDVILIIDAEGVIRDIAVNRDDLMVHGVGGWIDLLWVDTVLADSTHKIEELLDAARTGKERRWREVHHPTPRGEVITLSYMVVGTGRDGRVIAIGRDDAASRALQQRLMQAQQSMEREYVRLRDAEARYRLLFQSSSEAVLVVEGATRRVVEANPTAEALFGAAQAPLKGKAFARLFDRTSQDAAAGLLAAGRGSNGAKGPKDQLSVEGRDFNVSAALFRQDRAEYFLVRLTGEVASAPSADELGLAALIDGLPDPFVATDEQLNIVAHNSAFLDLVRLATKDQAVGLSLHQFLGRPDVDRSLLISNLREHGVLNRFGTVVRTPFDVEEVEVSAVRAPHARTALYGFTIRRMGRRPADLQAGRAPELAHSVAKLTDLVGRVSMKELVRETTELVERLCIEAALELTHDNRASAAQILGLSRQSLYSKMRRFGLGNLGPDDD